MYVLSNVFFYLEGSKTFNGTNGTLLSPNYPGSYLRDFKMTYTVIAPSGHVVLNFTELKLFGRVNFGDEVSVFDGSSTSKDDRLNTLTGDSKTENKWFVGSANKLTVVFYASKDNVPQKVYRFKAEYYMKENGEYFFVYSECRLRRAGLFLKKMRYCFVIFFQVKRCIKPIWPNTKSERDSTLPGWLNYFLNSILFYFA